jgi:pimeloyl-ACP methyl ester carboxylesterase
MQLIFIHGSGGCKESWTYQTRYFADSLALDLPGHPEGRLLPTVDDYVEWLKGVVKEKGFRRVVLVGHSLGGAIVLLYALKYPEDLAGIVTVGSGARLRVHPQFLEGLEKMLHDPQAENPLAGAYASVDPALAQVLQQRMAENGPAAALNDLRACDRFDIMDRLSQISVPTLAIVGDQDVMTPPKYSLYLAEHLPRAKAVIIPGGTHMVMAEKPEEVNRAIAAFLKDLDGPTES